MFFDCANPVPEAWPWEAKAAGARIVGTGRSDFPDQLNTSLVFPGLFRGALDVWARTITDEMAIAVAHELAGYAETRWIHADDILASMLDRGLSDLAPSRAEGPRPRAQGVAELAKSAAQIHADAATPMQAAREVTSLLVRAGLIAEPHASCRDPVRALLVPEATAGAAPPHLG